MAERTRALAAALAAAAVLCIACGTPAARFMRTGEEYSARGHAPGKIAVYLPPDLPERPYRMVGSIIVPRMCSVGSREESLEELRKKAAAVGVDGVMNVALTTRNGRVSSFGCAGGATYHNEDSYTYYEARGDAFVWGE
jgi:hypothetical protein